MKIVVCFKHVPRENGAVLPVQGFSRESVSGTINPYDRAAIKRAIDAKNGGDEIIALTMGPPNAEESLIETLAMGFDRAILLTDKKFSGADTLATSYVLYRAIEKIGDVDIVLCGSRTVDSETGHIGPQLAELLGLPLMSYVNSFEISKRRVTADRICDRYIEELESILPALITFSHHCTDRIYPSLKGLNMAFNTGEITVWDAESIDADPKRIGKPGSATFVERILKPDKQRTATVINDDRTGETIEKLFELLKNRNVLLPDRVKSRRGFEGFDL